jgi:ferredoxin-type protein NapG
MPTKLSRRNLFRLKPADLVQLLRDSRLSGAAGVRNGGTAEIDEPKRYFRPPGARPNETDFLSVCQRCAHCAEACPHGVIDLLGPVAGTAEGTPALHPDRNPCHWCPDFPCVQACPSGALRLGADGKAPPIGQAHLHLDTCLTGEGILCETCALYCPANVKAVRMKNRQPQIDEDACVGCGLCAYHCESAPVSIRIGLSFPREPRTGSDRRA